MRVALLWVGVILFSSALHALAQVASTEVNQDFESMKVGESPRDWFVPTPGFSAKIAAESGAHGKQFLALRQDKKSTRQSPSREPLPAWQPTEMKFWNGLSRR